MKIIYTPPQPPKIEYPPWEEAVSRPIGTIAKHKGNYFKIVEATLFSMGSQGWEPITKEEADQIINNARKLTE